MINKITQKNAESAKTLVLHIGMPKTGTSTIQDTFGASQQLLREQGIYFPKERPFNHSYEFASQFLNNPENSIHFKSKRIHKSTEIQDECARLKKLWVKRFTSNEFHTAIISAESLTKLNRVEIKRLKGFTEGLFNKVIIVAYARHPNTAIASNWEQRIKMLRPGESMDHVLQNVKKQYKFTFLRNWEEEFGEENIVLRPFAPETFYKGDLVEDFLYHLGLSSEIAKQRTPSNTSMGTNGVALLHAYNKKYPIFKGHQENPDRGLADKIHVFYKILRQVSDKRLQIEIKFSQNEATEINKEIRYINRFFPEDQQFDPVTASEAKTNLPQFEDIPTDYIVDLINEYNKYIDRILKE